MPIFAIPRHYAVAFRRCRRCHIDAIIAADAAAIYAIFAD